MSGVAVSEGTGGIDHVLFCVADQWRGDVLGALGTPGVVTPNLDALAADGVLFANHWCQASPCGPSRSSLLTGTHLPTHGQWTNDHPADHGLATLPAVLASASIRPVLIGYTDTPHRAPPSGSGGGTEAEWASLVDPAFEVALPFIWQHDFPTWRAELRSRGYDLDGDLHADLDGGHPFGLYAPDGEPDGGGLAPAHYRAEDSDVAFLTDAAIAAIEAWTERTMLHLNWLRPHPPMTAPRPYHRLVDPDEVSPAHKPLPLDRAATRHPYFELTVPGRSMTEYLQRRCRVEDVAPGDDRLLRAAYYGLCAEVDAGFGRIVDELKRTGRYDSTLIIFTSDHGESLGDHWLYGRRGPFDGHFSVPCIIRDPREAAAGARGSVVRDLTANIDLLPTICAGMGVEVPATVEGRSLERFLHGPSAGSPVEPWRDHVRFDMSWDDHLPRPVRESTAGSAGERRFSAVRTDRYRLVTFPRLEPMLFDLVDDPDEIVDRGADPAYRTVRRDLEGLLAGSTG